MARDIEKRRDSTRRRRRSLNVCGKIYDLETLCNMEVTLFMRSRENKQGFVYIPLNGAIWTPSVDEIVSSETAALGLG